jgi:hypothetical protein
MSRPKKFECNTKTFNLVMRERQYEILMRKSRHLSGITNKQVSVADIIRLCVDLHMEDTCDEVERRYRAQGY